MFENYINKLNDLQAQSNQINEQMRALYMQVVFLTWRWWLCAALTVVPWVLWIIWRKKDSTARLLFAGFIVTIIAMLLDDIGVELNFWNYNVDIDAINPSFFLWDVTMLPIVTMTFLQHKPQIHPIWKALALAAFASFIVEPLFSWMGFYDPEAWMYIYSFPIYIVIYLIAHLCSTRVSFAHLK